MKINYDKQADSKYIELRPRTKIEKTHEVEEWFIVDYDKNNEIVGVEILSASEHPGTIIINGGRDAYYLAPPISVSKPEQFNLDESNDSVGASSLSVKLEAELVG